VNDVMLGMKIGALAVLAASALLALPVTVVVAAAALVGAAALLDSARDLVRSSRALSPLEALRDRYLADERPAHEWAPEFEREVEALLRAPTRGAAMCLADPPPTVRLPPPGGPWRALDDDDVVRVWSGGALEVVRLGASSSRSLPGRHHVAGCDCPGCRAGETPKRTAECPCPDCRAGRRAR
jgi:hypothetical protein